MISLLSYFIRNKIASLMISLLFIILGLISLKFLPLEMLPKVQDRGYTILTRYTGYDSKKIEESITKPIEEALAGLAGLNHLYSISKDGISRVHLLFSKGVNIQTLGVEIRYKLSSVSSTFSKEVQKPIVLRYDPSQKPIIILALTNIAHAGQTDILSDESKEIQVKKLRTYAEKKLKGLFERINGVNEVFISGGLERELVVFIHKKKLESHKLSLSKIIEVIQYNNINIPLGKIKKNQQEIFSFALGRYTNINNIKNLVIKKEKGMKVIKLSDIADIKDYHKQKSDLSTYNGKKLITIYIQKSGSANSLKIIDQVKKIIQNQKKQGVGLKILYDMSTGIKNSLNNLLKTLLLSGLVGIFVLAFFIKKKKALIGILLAVPFSLIPVFFFMFLQGITVNMMSLAGLALGVGMLLDNSIVVLEHLEKKSPRNPKDAIFQLREIASPLISSTLTTIIIFLPFLLQQEDISRKYVDMALTVVYSISLSLLYSLFILPSLYLWISGNFSNTPKKHLTNKDHFLRIKVKSYVQKKYKIFLEKSFSFSKMVFFSFLLLFMSSLIFYSLLPKESLDPFSSREILGYLELPPGTSFERTKTLSQLAQKKMKKSKMIESIQAKIEKSHTSFIIKTKKTAPTEKLLLDFQKSFDRFHEGFIYFTENVASGNNSKEINLNIYGDELLEIKKNIHKISKLLYQVNGIKNIIYRFKEGTPSYTIVINRKKAEFANFYSKEITDILRQSLYGPIATKFIEKNLEVDVRLKLLDKDIKELKDLKNLTLIGSNRTFIKLKNIASIVPSLEEGEIFRKDKKRTLTITLRRADIGYEKIISLIKRKLNNFPFKPGYGYRFDDSYEKYLKSKKELFLGVLLSILLIYLILSSLYQNFFFPLVIMGAIPLGFSGVFIVLFFLGESFSLSIYIGLMILIGILVNNSIILLDEIKKGIEKDKSKKLSILKIKKNIISLSSNRILPILMTNLTTILALLPVIILKEEGSHFFKPIALTLFSGLLFSLTCTIFIVPIIMFWYYKRTLLK